VSEMVLGAWVVMAVLALTGAAATLGATTLAD
jgi:hypothetical protein